MTRSLDWLMVTGAAVVTIVFLLYAPVLSHELRSDDFQWVHQAHRAQVQPSLLFADLDSFYRPLNTWSLVVDRMLWGSNPAGYHLTNLVLHALAAMGLGLAALRLGLSRVASSTVAAVWAASPFAEEAAVWVSARFQSFLMLGWAGFVAAWPRRGEEWTTWRKVAVVLSLVVAAAAKESWVVIPVAGVLLEYHRTEGKWVRIARSTVPLFLLSAVYVVSYFCAFPGDKDYFRWSFSVLAKLPHMLAAFLYFEELKPMEFTLSWQAVAASLAVAAAVVLGVRRRSLPIMLGAACIALSSLPVLLVPYLPTRHTAIPYAGFVLIMAAAFELMVADLPQRWRRVAPVGVAALVLLVVLAGGVVVRADLVDYGQVSRATTQLLDETREVLPGLALDRPVIVVRDENENPLLEVSRNPHGRIKIWYPRHADPYGLVDSAALLDWTLEGGGTVVTRVDDWERLDGVPGQLLVHRAGGFARPPVAIDDTAAEARRWIDAGRRLRVVQGNGAGEVANASRPGAEAAPRSAAR